MKIPNKIIGGGANPAVKLEWAPLPEDLEMDTPFPTSEEMEALDAQILRDSALFEEASSLIVSFPTRHPDWITSEWISTQEVYLFKKHLDRANSEFLRIAERNGGVEELNRILPRHEEPGFEVLWRPKASNN